jgi:hypothetical protein
VRDERGEEETTAAVTSKGGKMGTIRDHEDDGDQCDPRRLLYLDASRKGLALKCTVSADRWAKFGSEDAVSQAR